MQIKDRVKILNHPFLSDGYIKDIIEGCYIIKLDEKAPNEYAYETDEVLMFGINLKLITQK